MREHGGAEHGGGQERGRERGKENGDVKMSRYRDGGKRIILEISTRNWGVEKPIILDRLLSEFKTFHDTGYDHGVHGACVIHGSMGIEIHGYRDTWVYR